jgi:transposase InsO family protein
MPWKVSCPVSQRKDFLASAMVEGANISALAREYGITRTTAYKWLDRVRREGWEGLGDRSRRPHAFPLKTNPHVEGRIIELRDKHPAWGARKLRHCLLRDKVQGVPAPSTITEILRRNGLLDPEESLKHTPFKRFEHPAPNDLWQMDFKGEFPLEKERCYPLTAIDDHSRYVVCLQACPNLRTETTRVALISKFRTYGLPRRMTMDNGAPFAIFKHGRPAWTRLTVWLVRLGIHVSHSRPHHPQTQGKDERFHRTLNEELISRSQYNSLEGAQESFDAWLRIYNCERPHEALSMDVPSSRYRPSERQYPERLESFTYGDADIVRKVQSRGQIKYKNNRYFIGEAFTGEYIALKPTRLDGRFDVYYCHQRIAGIDLKAQSLDD